MEHHVLAIMAKSPEKGKVKTRLAETIGDDDALVVYKNLLSYTIREANCALWETTVYWAGNFKNDVNIHDFKSTSQKGDDLGERMSYGFTQEFENGAERVVMIGADCAEITMQHIERAFGMLKIHDVVIGPATDGGYYLIAMNEIHNELLNAVPWSTEHVLETTKELAEENHLSIGYLETLSDVDHASDLEKHSWLLQEKSEK
ncbi:MAG: TIGR04282 family arsenosugar biosynthesis glycosyltransferase [Flavobacteriales bacterium]